MTRARHLLVLSLLSLLALAGCRHQAWVTTWGAAPQRPDEPGQLTHATIRQTIHVSLGGEWVRLTLSNRFGHAPVTLGSVHLARRGPSPSAIVPGSDRPLTFRGSTQVTIPPGEEVQSDEVRLAVPAFADLSVSMFVPREATLETEHAMARATTVVSADGDFTGATDFTPARSAGSWYFTTALEVFGEGQSLVILGDSTSDGDESTPDANHRWPDFLARRLPGIGVVNEGMAGNRVLHDFLGTRALDRLERDVLDRAGVRWVLVAEGTNDLGIPGAFDLPAETITADQLIAAYQQLISRIQARGLVAIGATLMPFEGTTFEGFWSAAAELKRQALNSWIRGSGAFDFVIDFDAALRDPAHPTRLRPDLASPDHLHPSDRGYEAMAEAVDLPIFRAASRASDRGSPASPAATAR